MDGLVIDNFAGGGGASIGIEAAIGRAVDAAINHDPEALAMHEANHPGTRHYVQDVWKIDPCEVVKDLGGGRVSLAWFSPDCKDFSKAKGGKPVKRNIRDLAWVVVKWAKLVRPRVMMLENVEEFQDWGPLDQNNKRIKGKEGQEFNRLVAALRRQGYAVEWRELRASDYGAPTIRKRLFMIARCDGAPIVWPSPTHGNPKADGFDDAGLEPWRTAAECIDWSIPTRSIFTRKKPLVPNTMARIARGMFKFVLTHPQPFIIPVTHHGDQRVYPLDEPMRTVTSTRRGEFALVAPFIKRDFGCGTGKPADHPIGTITSSGNGHADLCAAFLAQHNTGVTGRAADAPVSTITQRGTNQALVTSWLMKMKGTCRHGQDMRAPMPTIQAGGLHCAEVRAFLMKYYGTGGQLQSVDDPMHTLTAKARMGLVTVAGIDYQVVDIGTRMLEAPELFRAQDFPRGYKIDPVYNGQPLTKTKQIACCGNSVPPIMAKVLVLANLMGGADVPALREVA